MPLQGTVVLSLAAALGMFVFLSTSGCSDRCSCTMGDGAGHAARPGCSLSNERLRLRQVSIKAVLTERVQRWHKLPDGFAFELPGDDQTAREVLNTVLLERKCCNFVAFTLAFESDNGALWLQVRTAAAHKDILRDILEPTGVLAVPPSAPD